MRARSSTLYLALCAGGLALALPFGDVAVGIVFLVVSLASATIIIRAARHRRPPSPEVWFGFALGILLFLIGGVAGELTRDPDAPLSAGFPGPREVFDGLAYLCFILAVWRMGQVRGAIRDRTNLLDALIGVGGFSVLVWTFIMSEYVQNDELSLAGRITGPVFSLGTLVLATFVARLAIGPGRRSPAYYLIAVAAFGGFTADLFFSLEAIDVTPFPGSTTLSSIISATAIGFLGASALHPSMVDLTMPAVDTIPNMTDRRLAAMTLAVLIPPIVLVSEVGTGAGVRTAVIIGAWMVLSVMVMVRIFGLARSRERVAEFDRILRNADASLATATTREQMETAALHAAQELVAPRLSRASIIVSQEHRWIVGRSVGVRNLEAQGREVEISHITEIDEQHGDDVADLEVEGDRARWRCTVPLRTQGRINGYLSISSDVPPGESVTGPLYSLASDLALAIESASLREGLARERSDRRFRALVENSGDIIMVLKAGRIAFVSPAGPRLLGHAEPNLIGQPPESFAVERHRSLVSDAIAGADRTPHEVQFATARGDLRWFEIVVADMHDQPEIEGLVITATEATARKEAELSLLNSEARFRSLVQHSSDLVLVLDSHGDTTWAGASVETVLGYTEDQVLGQRFDQLVSPTDRKELSEAFYRLAIDEEHQQTCEVRIHHASGAWITLDVTITDLRGDESVDGIVVNAHDVTDRKSLEKSLRHQALHDDLTGIPNRVLFRDRVEQALARRASDITAVMVIDIDDFKTVNDGLGHTMGDDLLKVVAHRLRHFLRAGDTAARLGGDEFAVLLEGCVDREEVLDVGRRLLRVLSDPIDVEGRELTVHSSIGVALSTDLDRPTPGTLLRGADLAMYSAKNRGKARLAVFDESMHHGAFERLELKSDLTQAVERDELLLHYQPIVNMADNRVAGVEALMRWMHPERGMVSPGTFIPLAEETGLVIPMGVWLFGESLGQLARWQADGTVAPGFTMSLNLSGRQLEDPNIAEEIADAINDVGVHPDDVVIELTESVLIADDPLLEARLRNIRDLGVGLYTDDFGVGYATYASLQRHPFNGVKIDRSLISGLDGEDRDVAVEQVRSIIEMAHRIDRRVVAEGVETEQQEAILRDLQCDFAQGFYFARPAAADDIAARLAPPPTVAEDSRVG